MNTSKREHEPAEAAKVVSAESKYWNNFYAKFNVAIPSQFCVLTASEADKTKPVIEFGCGNGRDSIYLARIGFKVYSGDLSEEVITHNIKKVDGAENTNPVQFQLCDVSKADDVKALVEKARSENKESCLTLYNRFFLHSLDDDQERAFLTALSKVTVAGDVLYMEYRCTLDAQVDKLYKGHYRRYVDTAKLVDTLESELGFKVSYERTGQGMAKYKSEDPFVSRLICERLKGEFEKK
jgi:SAM-dependent methyltransferase